MTVPIIGITTYQTSHAEGFTIHALAQMYSLAVVNAGGIPILIPLDSPNEDLKILLSRLDGIMFSGGEDIDPELFGGVKHPEVKFINRDRDRIEILLIKQAVEFRKPIFGICRGIQSINVALGGTLYTHIPDQMPGAFHHSHIEGNPRDFLAHKVLVDQDTSLYKILESLEVQVNSLHHQGILKLAPDLKATAYAPDGLVEAVELPTHPFCVAVQWHPEWLTAFVPMASLFSAFVEAASL